MLQLLVLVLKCSHVVTAGFVTAIVIVRVTALVIVIVIVPIVTAIKKCSTRSDMLPLE